MARVSAVVQSDSAFTVHLDDFDLFGPAPVPATPIPPFTPAPTIPPSVTPPSVTPTPRPGPTQTPRPAPTRTPRSSSTPPPELPPSAATEPLVFASLVNGSFEDLRGDGTPYGWRKQGGEISSTGEPRADGSRSLALSSQTSSTKWAYQTVSVAGGEHYRASSRRMPAKAPRLRSFVFHGTAATMVAGPRSVLWTRFTRPRPPTVDSDGWQPRSVQAPAGAASAKLRLMLRPLSDQPTIAYFDAASFSLAEPGAAEVVLAAARSLSGNADASAPGGAAEEPLSASPETRLGLANVKPVSNLLRRAHRWRAVGTRAGPSPSRSW